MKPEITAFRVEARRAKELVAFASILKRDDVSRDVSDIYRAALVKAVSGYDKFVHELVLRGMLEAAYGRRPQTDAFGKFKVSLLSSLAAAQGVITESWLGPEIVLQHGHLAFQKCEKVADAVRLISGVQLWPTISAAVGVDTVTLKSEVDWIMDRRNQIVHEADIDPIIFGQKRSITRKEVLKSIALIYQVAREIDKLAG